MTGQFFSPSITFDTITLNILGGGAWPNIFIVKFDASGNALWAKSTGSGSWGDRGNCVSTDGNGNVYWTGIFGGSSIGFGSFILTNLQNSIEIFIVKYDSIGNALWARGSSGFPSYNLGISTDSSGNFFIAVSAFNQLVFGTDTINSIDTSYSDVFVVKFDSAGNLLWSKVAGGINEDNNKSVCVDAFGNVFITGYFASPYLTFGTTNLTNAGSLSYDIFIAKLDALVGIEEHSNFSNGVIIFPNPTTDILNFNHPNLSIELYDLSGRKLLQQKITGNQLSIKNLLSGVYFLKASNGISSNTLKVLKQ